MTELDQARSEHDDPAKEYEPAPDRDHGHDRGDAGMQATLDETDRLPARPDARAATWDEDPGYDDDGDLGAEYDGDLDALTAGDDELPTRQDARAATWDDGANYDNENDPDTQDGEDSGTLAAADDQLPTRPDARAAAWDDHPDYDDENSPGTPDDEDPGAFADGDYVLDGDQGALDQASAGQDTPPHTARTDAPPGEPSDGPAIPPAEQQERSPAGTSERITGLEAENARLGKTITDLQARLERLEHGPQAEPSRWITGQERDAAQKEAVKAENPQTRRWHRPTDEALALGAAAAGGVITTVADYAPFLHADVAGMAASAVAVGAAAITWMRARREAGHANRPED